ncbi:MAG: ribose-phosphate pyrophosphokinase [Bacteroidota bacterium]|nr:ribose-phosphate pyrophosphokinase [Bacteroidota bacterium]MDP4217916.1 ribose-phosphate pyrophosphokinase [Bacteroidota bacterium]MDP4245735.1 ribose-phosphate pyrophosphokinase [Bacteroidota bacterium]MDP4255167.1 ribose-phosphate pyrophosphokinase [Bacteroidota bacterium]MDP4260711.1 ribose-phosphate pyrophosphokinase [Bacteroidota bacterium]
MKLFVMKSSSAFGEKVAARLNMPVAQHEEVDFEDGEHKARPLENVRNEDVCVIQSLYGDGTLSVNDKLCRLLFFLGALKDAAASRITAVVPYLCYARKDRKTKPRDPVTTRYMAQLFEAVGVDRVMTVDVHNLQAFQNAFRCQTEHLEARGLFARHLMDSLPDEDLVIMSPDIGGIKRAEQLQRLLHTKYSREIPLVFMEKYRSGGQVWGEKVAGEVKDKTVAIVDDLISTGGTLARAARACHEAGARKVLAMATHGIFVGKPDEKLLEDSLQQIVVTNTIPAFRLEQTRTKEKLLVLDVAPLFAEAIRRLYTGGSITELLEA